MVPASPLKTDSLPCGFYMSAQGSLIIYVAIIWYYAHYMNNLDKEYGVHEGELD